MACRRLPAPAPVIGRPRRRFNSVRMRAALAVRDVWNRLWARLGSPPADLHAAPPAQERLGRVLGVLSIAWIVLVGCWGITGLFPDGHFASSAAIGTAAANMWRLH